MQNKKLINSIKSKYILKHIISFIKDKNFHFKLFTYSQLYQKKLDINLIYYKKIYLKNICNIDDFLLQYNYDKKKLNKKYNNFLIENKLNKKKFEKLIYDINNEENDITTNKLYQKKISIDSPLFDIISKTKSFENNYIIYIPQDIIAKYKLKRKYINFFNKLNNNNIKYSSIDYVFPKKTKITYLKQLNIDFTKIKRLKIEKDFNYSTPEYNIKTFTDNNFFFGNFFSINNIKNNLVFLDIICNCYLKPNLFENINNFKSLKYLYLTTFIFERNFFIKLNNLKILSCINCKNINICENINYKELTEYKNYEIQNIEIFEKFKMENLEILDLGNNKISDIKVLEKCKLKNLKILNLYSNYISDIKIFEKVKFKELEVFNLSYNKISDINILEKVDFKKLKILYLFTNLISNIEVLEKVKFDKLEILNLAGNFIKDINILEFVNLKELKDLDLSFNIITDITVLEKVQFEKLEILFLRGNLISDINILEKVNFKELKELDLNNNKIFDIKVLEKIKFKNLKELIIFSNEIEQNKFSDLINKCSKLFSIYL